MQSTRVISALEAEVSGWYTEEADFWIRYLIEISMEGEKENIFGWTKLIKEHIFKDHWELWVTWIEDDFNEESEQKCCQNMFTSDFEGPVHYAK